MTVKLKWIAILSVVIIFGGVFIADMAGFWITESNKIPALVEQGEFEGEFNPEDIRGAYTFSDISKSFNVATNILAQAFCIDDENINEFQVKNLESIYTDLPQDIEIGTASVKYFVSLYTGISTVDIEYLPKTAVDILYQQGKINEEKQEELLEYSIDIKQVEYNEIYHEDEGFVINGETTVEDIISNGIKQEDIEKVLGIEIVDTKTYLKTLCEQNGLKFGEVKNDIYSFLDND